MVRPRNAIAGFSALLFCVSLACTFPASAAEPKPLPGVKPPPPIVAPEPDAPDATSATDADGWVDAGQWKYRVSGSVRVDVGAGSVDGSRR